MTKSAKSDLQTNTTPKQPLAFKNHIFTMAAAFAGVIFGVLGSMGFVGNYLNSQFAAQTAALNSRLVAVAPAAATSSACYGSSTATTGAKPTAKVASAAMPTTGMTGEAGKGGDVSSPAPAPTAHTPFVSQMINGTISNTGPNSTNTIDARNTFTYTSNNTNNISTTNNNNQSSSTGNATSSNNTTGGAATTGSATNDNATSTSISVNN